MQQTEIYLLLMGISLIVGLLFNKTTIPTPLVLVITGILLSCAPGMPEIKLQPKVMLDVFIPLLLYHVASADLSWKDVKRYIRPIMLLSVGHVFFIAVLVAVVIHALLPALGWPLSFVLGAIVAPPDDVAILAIAENVNFPHRALTILKGESLLNDAAALILFRFSLVAVFTHIFYPWHALFTFLVVVVAETVYGFLLGSLIGKFRQRLKDPMLQVIASILTPFAAYIPAEKLGGCGILATVIAGFVIDHHYIELFPPEARLIGRAVWSTIAFSLQSIIFLMVGLNFQFTLRGISAIPLLSLIQYSGAVILVVIIGRFIWVYAISYPLRFLFAFILKKDPYPPWQLPFLVSWAGMRGIISLAAALAVPILPAIAGGINPRDLIIFLVFTVIAVTLLVQGLSLSWLMQKLGLHSHGLQEQYNEHLTELSARVKIARAVLRWLRGYQKEITDNAFLLDKVKVRIKEYQLRYKQLSTVLKDHHSFKEHHDGHAEQLESTFLSVKINELERHVLLRLWHENKISHALRNKLLKQLDHRFKHIVG